MPEPFTLYKLIVLYMLQKVDFPLTNAQISEFILDRGYTTYFTLQSVLSELSESGMVHQETIRNTSYYTLTDAGAEALHYFQNRISKMIRDDIDKYIADKKRSCAMRSLSSLITTKIQPMNIPSAVS